MLELNFYKGIKEDTVSQVEHWAAQRGISATDSEIPQAIKTIEEATELAEAIIRKNTDKIIDGIGDVLVTLIVQARLQGVNLQWALEQAYDEIKDRDGRLENGFFCKRKDEVQLGAVPQVTAYEDCLTCAHRRLHRTDEPCWSCLNPGSTYRIAPYWTPAPEVGRRWDDESEGC